MSTSSGSPLESDGIPCPSCGLALQFGTSDGTLQHVDGSDLCVRSALPVPITEAEVAPLRAPYPQPDGVLGEREDWHYSERSRAGRFPWGVLMLFVLLAAGAAAALGYVAVNWP